jgi:hypothetical protein
MNSISVHRDDLRGGRLIGAVRYVQQALGSLTWQEAAYFLFTGLLVAALNSVMGIEMLRKSGESAFLVHGVLLPLLIGPFVMAGWVLADRAENGAWPRNARLTAGLLLSVTAAVVLVPLLLSAIGLKLPTELRSDGKAFQIPAWSKHVALWLDVAIYCGLTFAVLEFRRRRERSQQVLQAALTEQAQLSRQLLESRLAAMQAQVEPQFLFDSLVDVQATYDRDARSGADVMDRLINYLRVALPRLREQGSTVQAEVELLAAYLGVVAARHHGRPSVHFVLAPEAAGARFYPMLLLPLVQRAIRLAAHGHEVPGYVELVVKRHGDELGVLLRIEAAGLCTDDPELVRVRERLAGLYADRAQLLCIEPQPGCTEFVLRVPQALAS